MGKAGILAAAMAIALVAAPASGQGFLKQLEDATGGLGSKFGLGGSGSPVGALSNDEIGKGIKEALRVGTERLVGQLGSASGFSGDPQVRIPLPATLKKVQSTLSRFGCQVWLTIWNCVSTGPLKRQHRKRKNSSVMRSLR